MRGPRHIFKERLHVFRETRRGMRGGIEFFARQDGDACIDRCAHSSRSCIWDGVYGIQEGSMVLYCSTRNTVQSMQMCRNTNCESYEMGVGGPAVKYSSGNMTHPRSMQGSIWIL